ncbi:MAG: hypothetical protein GXX85_07345 [Ignavibacteria bacterium]|nr:hypothetical protein [Ignavibacteria bacterium]
MKLKTKILGLIFILFSIGFIFFLNWLANNPEQYIDDIKIGYKGKIVDKYYSRENHIKIKINNSELDISGLSDQLITLSNIGDTLIKYKNTNCCELIQKSRKLSLQYKHIPEDVLKRSEYLKKLYETKCN